MNAKPSVYVETSVFSVLVARPSSNLLAAACQQTTRIWWQNDAADYSLFASDEVRFEAASGDAEMARERLAYIDSIASLPLTKEAREISDSLIQSRILPPKARTDAAHLAIATVHEIQFLATWNCRHLANAQIFSQVARHLRKIGRTPPQVCTLSQLPKVKP